VRFRVCFLSSSVGNYGLVNLRPAGPLGGKVEKCDVASPHI
jgi:hypothetical protein